MAIFKLSKLKKVLTEVEVGGQNISEDEETNDQPQQQAAPVADDQADNAAPANDEGEDETPKVEVGGQPANPNENTDTPADNATGDTGGEENMPDSTGSDDTATDAAPDAGGDKGDGENMPDATGGDDTADASVDDATGDTGEEGGGEEQPEGSDQQQQSDDPNDEIFSDLTDEEMAAKNKKLKKDFIKMYDLICDIEDRVSSITKDDKIIDIIEFIHNKLTDLKDMIVDYIDQIYDSKSHVENIMYYNQCLAVLAGLNTILVEIAPDEDK